VSNNGDRIGHRVDHQALMLSIHRHVHVVAHVHRRALGHRAAIGIGQGERGLPTRPDLLHQAGVSRLALLESLDLLLQRRAGQLMDAGSLPIRCIQITQVLLHLLSYFPAGLLKFCLRKVLVVVVDRLECAPVNGQKFCPNEIHLCAQEDTLTEKRWPRLSVLFPELSNRLEIGSKFLQQPDELHVAMGFPLKSSAGANPVEVAIDGAHEHTPWEEDDTGE
jgi:hypothetical protein